MKFYIMNAQDHLTGSRKSSIADIVNSDNFKDETYVIYLCDCYTNSGAVRTRYVTSYADGISVSDITTDHTYVIDNGNGHRNEGHTIKVRTAIAVTNGKVTEYLGEIPNDKKIPLYVMK